MTKFIAHRGLSSIYYQNSEQAFLAAGKSKFFYGIETDVWITKDEEWVCCHDPNPFENKNLNIFEMTLEETQKTPLKAKNHGVAKVRGDVFICTTRRYLEINKKYNKVPVIELKNVPTMAQLESLVALVDEIIGLENAIFISFHARNIVRLVRMNKGIKTQILTSLWPQSKYYAQKGYDVDQNLWRMTKKKVKKLHALGREVNVWTVRDLASAYRMTFAGADYITTDYDYSRWFQSGGVMKPLLRTKNQPKQAVKYFNQGYNCCQSVLMAFAEDLWLNKRKAMALGSPFGGGVARTREGMCGVLTGVLMVIGLAHPSMSKEAIYNLSRKVIEEFTSLAKGTNCIDFLGPDIDNSAKPTERTPEYYEERPCPQLVEIGAKLAKKYSHF